MLHGATLSSTQCQTRFYSTSVSGDDPLILLTLTRFGPPSLVVMLVLNEIHPSPRAGRDGGLDEAIAAAPESLLRSRAAIV